MKWYVIPAVLTCGLNSMLAAVVLCLATYHLFTDKSTNAPIEPNKEWIRLVKCLIPFTACWMVFSVVGMYVSMIKQIWRATLVLAFYGLCFGVSIYFTIAFGNQLEIKEVDSQVLFKSTLKEIRAQAQENWIPEWLDNTQKQSKHCCGINTYLDYTEFWPDTPSKLARSCCKESKRPCPADMNNIPFPETPDDYFKVETGCMEEILDTVRHHIRESHHNCITMSTFIGCGILAYVILYMRQYLSPDDAPSDNQRGGTLVMVVGGGDTGDLDGSNMNSNILDNSNGQLIITSSGDIVGSIDSLGVQPLAAMESTSENRQFVSGQMQPAPTSSATRMNKANVATASYQLQQQSQQFQQQQPQQFQQQQPQQFQQQPQQFQQQQPQQFQQQQPQQFQQQQPQPFQQQQPQQFNQQPQQFQQQQPQQFNPQPQQFQQQQPQQQPQQFQQQQPQVLDIGSSVGSAVPGNSAVRREPFVANSGRKLAPEQTNQASQNLTYRAIPPVVITAADNAGNSARTEQQQTDPSSPPGSPKGRLKKIRKDVLAAMKRK